MDDPYIDNMIFVYAGLNFFVSLAEIYIGELFHAAIDSIMIDF